MGRSRGSSARRRSSCSSGIEIALARCPAAYSAAGRPSSATVPADDDDGDGDGGSSTGLIIGIVAALAIAAAAFVVLRSRSNRAT